MAHTTAALDVASGEILPVSVDITNALGPGDAVLSTTMAMHEDSMGEAITGAFIGTPIVIGATLSMTIDARLLDARNTYTIKALLTIQTNAKVVAVLIPVVCRV